MKQKQPYTYYKGNDLYVRVPYKCPLSGTWKSKRKKVSSLKEARDVAAELKMKVRDLTPQMVDGATMTFEDIFYRFTRPFPPYYKRIFIERFGKYRLGKITYEMLHRFKLERMKVLHRYTNQPREISTVNRELEALRRLFVFAHRRGFIAINPFDLGDPLISNAEENSRFRIPTNAEVTRLLEHATGDRAHLYPIILLALDTGLRKSKLLGLTRAQVEFDTGLIRLGRSKIKTKKHPPVIAMTKRAKLALAEWLQTHDDDAIFGQKDVKRSWGTLCSIAKVEGLHFHDLRHGYATRSILAGTPRDIVMKLTGHTEEATFDRYLNVDEEIAIAAALALDAFNEKTTT